MLDAFNTASAAARQIVYPNELAKNERCMTARCCEVSFEAFQLY